MASGEGRIVSIYKLITSKVTDISGPKRWSVRSASFGLVLHAQHIFANSVNFLATWGSSSVLFGKRSLKYKGSYMWNSLPESLKTIQSTSLFKHSLSVFLLTGVWSGIIELCTFMPYALCTFHLALHCLLLLLLSFYNCWPAKMGLVPFWQPSTLCFVAVIVQCCIFVALWRINLLSLVSLVTREICRKTDDKISGDSLES